jgi:hypothetical protein
VVHGCLLPFKQEHATVSRGRHPRPTGYGLGGNHGEKQWGRRRRGPPRFRRSVRGYECPLAARIGSSTSVSVGVPSSSSSYRTWRIGCFEVIGRPRSIGVPFDDHDRSGRANRIRSCPRRDRRDSRCGALAPSRRSV